jgi:hypothetical protein
MLAYLGLPERIKRSWYYLLDCPSVILPSRTNGVAERGVYVVEAITAHGVTH